MPRSMRPALLADPPIAQSPPTVRGPLGDPPPLHVRHLGQQQVTHVVAARVVELLEIVQINEQQRTRIGGARAGGLRMA